MNKTFDLVIIGGGIIGCAAAEALSARCPELDILLCEKEARLACHQTGHNSGVIHSGLYYQPGSLKATCCNEGREALYRFCAEQEIRHERCGKLVVAVNESELAALDELERRGKANGLAGILRLDAAEIRQHEPHVQGIAGLFVPQTGTVNFTEVTQALADLYARRGGSIRLNSMVSDIRRVDNGYQLQVNNETIETRGLINCAGLHCDRLARTAGLNFGLHIIPFRGEYYAFKAARRNLVKGLVYPVPDPQMPFLGVHLTRMLDGSVEAGPNAVLAWHREGYQRFDISLQDLSEALSFGGFWKLSARYWQQGIVEHCRSFSKRLFVRNLQQLLPDVHAADLVPGHSGVRAQAVDEAGRLVDDFCILTEGRMVHVLNAPSPAATASLSIAALIVDQVMITLD